MVEGFRWLWHHDLLRTLAITLGLLNLLAQVSGAIIVLFGQEVLGTSTCWSSPIFSTAAAVGGGRRWLDGVGRLQAHRLGPSLGTIACGAAASSIAIGLYRPGPGGDHAVRPHLHRRVWNVITVSLRQTIIPDRLLGRVNSVYRFFGWGVIPIGGLIGGVMVAVLDGPLSRRTPCARHRSSPASPSWRSPPSSAVGSPRSASTALARR